jgi:hypothetical protein
MKSGSLSHLEPSEPFQTFNGVVLPLFPAYWIWIRQTKLTENVTRPVYLLPDTAFCVSPSHHCSKIIFLEPCNNPDQIVRYYILDLQVGSHQTDQEYRHKKRGSFSKIIIIQIPKYLAL